MFAVIKTGGKQYKVAANDTLTIERLEGEPGDVVSFSSVLMLVNDAATTIGAPHVAGASVAGEIVEQARGPKVIAFKKRRRKNSKRKRGHRQDLTIVRITDILTDGATPPPRAARSVPANDTPANDAPIAVSADAAPVGLMAAQAGGRDASNLSLISGIGPTIEKKLRAAGITSWETIAAWTDADLDRWDEELKLRGRARREEWPVQARELLDGKPPRAKADQAEADSGKDI